PINARCRNVSAACSGARNSTKPAGRSRAASNSRGAELTATTRFEKGQGASPGFGLLLAVVAMVEVSPFRYEFERKPVDELESQFEGQPGATSNSKAYLLKEIERPVGGRDHEKSGHHSKTRAH